jgi:hypothetical protein
VSDPAERRMSLDEFLHRDDGAYTRYELIDRFPVTIAPPAEGHRILAVRLASRMCGACGAASGIGRAADIDGGTL